MRYLLPTILLIAYGLTAHGIPPYEPLDTVPYYGSQHRSSELFRTFYRSGDLSNYLDNLDDYTTYQTETTGGFASPDRLTFSVSGNSYRWNRFYVDGFRIDSRFMPGSTPYHIDMYTHSLDIDYHHSQLWFTNDGYVPDAIRATYNLGGLGGISRGTKQFINLLHLTAQERQYKPFRHRNKMQGMGSIDMNYTVRHGEGQYRQHLFFDYGVRKLVDFDETGIDDYYPEDFFKLSLDGQLPVKPSRMFDTMGYLFTAGGRSNMGSEFYLGRDETAHQGTYSLSVYGKRQRNRTSYTQGLTLAFNTISHDDLNYSRNIIDQDGEGFEPWMPDGLTTELSYAVTLRHDFRDWLSISYDGYNSLLHFAPSRTSFSNAAYMRQVNMPFVPLYVYDWQSLPFATGLLENTASLEFRRRLAPWAELRANVDVTLDAMIVRDETMFRPNWQVMAGIKMHPCRWFAMEVNVSRSRVAFNYDDARYFSNRYLNGDISYWQDRNGNQRFDDDERSGYFTSTGGASRSKVSMLRQPSYLVVDIPIHFRFGRHTISFLNSYRKYFDVWTTTFDGDADDYGHYSLTDDGKQIFFLDGGKPADYVVSTLPKSYMHKEGWTNFISNTPYYFSSVIKYEYVGPKFFAMLSWQSYLMAGFAGLGNGPVTNDIAALTESTANPNAQIKGIGRYDQDRAYIARLHLGWNINEHFTVALTGKFKDGQPFSGFDVMIEKDGQGNTQAAMWNTRTKGINPLNGDFGSREDMFLNFDLRASYRGTIRRRPVELEVLCYNIYDFGTELTEYCFTPDKTVGHGRFAMSECIPRGLAISLKVGL